MTSKSQGYYHAERPASHRHDYDWDHGENGSSRGAADGGRGAMPPPPRPALVNRRERRPLRPLHDHDGNFDDGYEDDDDDDARYPGESQGSRPRGKCPPHRGEDDGDGENNDRPFEEKYRGDDRETEPAAVGNYARGNGRGRDSRGIRRPRIDSRRARDDESAKENYGGDVVNGGEYYHEGVAARRGRVEKIMARRDRRRGEVNLRSDGEQSFFEDEEYSHVCVDENMTRRNPLQERNQRETNVDENYPEDDDESFQENDGRFYQRVDRRGEVEKTMTHYDQYHNGMKNSHSDGYKSFQENDGCFHQHAADVGDRREWPMDGIDFNQIQRPQSMLFGEEEDYYEADDEYYHAEQDAPVKEITFFRGQGDEENQNGLDFETDPRDDERCDEDSTLGYSDSDASAPEHQNSAKPSSRPIFHSSESLDVIRRIESVMESLVKFLDRKEAPILRGYVNPESFRDGEESDGREEAVQAFAAARTNGDPKFHRSFGNIAQCRSFASICLVMSFVHRLLLSNRTTTTREVYYVFVTHFRNQRECDGVILDVAKILGVSRRSLGLSASPKGWFCGCVEITRKGALPSGKDVSGTIDGTALPSIQGLPVTREWTERDESGRTEDGVEIRVSSRNAKVILVIEKEGVYNRLSEERIFDRFPCILVTGKGFPDLATRALVHALHGELDLPVVGLCDCNPYGISVLALYHRAGDRMGVDGRRRYTVPIRWLGLRPSEVARLRGDMPETVFQKLTDFDNKRISSLLDQDDTFLTEEDEEEVLEMGDAGYKVELEALYWLGPDYMGNWVVEMLKNEHERSFVE